MPNKIRIDPTNPFPPTFGFSAQQYCGPWKIGASLYLAAFSAGVVTVYKSVDNGTTWTIPDSANRPNITFSFQSQSAVWDGATTIHIAYTDTNTTARVTTFSTVTDTYSGVTTAALTIASGGSLSYIFMALQSGGNYRVYFLQADPADASREHAWISEWNGSAWSAPAQVDTNLTGIAESQFTELGQGTADVTHLWWQNDVGTRTLYYRPLSAGGVLGSIQTIISGSASTITIGRPVVWQGKIVLPYKRHAALGDDRPAVMLGSPEATPAWSSEDADPGQPLCTNIFASVYGSTLRIWYLADNNSTVHQIWYAENSGSGWGTPVLFWDEATDPVIPPPPIQFVHNLSFTRLADGTWVGFFGLEVASDGGQLCTIFFIAQGGPAPPTPPSPGPGQLGLCRTILHLFQHSVSPQSEITKDRHDDWTECGTPSNKFFQGCKIDADTFGVAKSVQIRDADTGTLHVLQPATINHAGRQTIPYSFATPFLAHMVRRESLDFVAWRHFGIEYIWEATPESVRTWETQFTAHGMHGYLHIQKIDAAWESTAPLTLTITSFDGRSPAVITLPSTGGVYQKKLLMLTPNKGQLYQYTAASASPFRLFLNDWIVWVGQWGRTGPYVPYRMLGGEFGDKARI